MCYGLAGKGLKKKSIVLEGTQVLIVVYDCLM